VKDLAHRALEFVRKLRKRHGFKSSYKPVKPKKKRIMKLNKKIILIIAALLMLAFPALAQDASTLPPELLSTNIKDWQLNGVTLLLAIQLAGRAYAGLSKGGGLVGIFKGIVFGTNTPKSE